MLKKYPKFVLFLVLFCLIGVGVFYFFNTWKGDETQPQTQTTQILVLLNSHSHPEAGDEWAVSFETIGPADLTITPTDLDSIDDLDFVSLTCDGEEKTEGGPLQIFDGDVIFYSGWQCDGRGEVIHLVNIARKHTLKFQFKDKIAFAYNNPDFVTDTFNDTSKIFSTSSMTVNISAGQVYLATCGNNGAVCSTNGDCCSTYCYIDADGDGYASTTGTATCRANPSLGTDCCDSDANSHPGVGYSTTTNACGSWDWDCSGSTEKNSNCSGYDKCTLGAADNNCYTTSSCGPKWTLYNSCSLNATATACGVAWTSSTCQSNECWQLSPYCTSYVTKYLCPGSGVTCGCR